MLSIVIGLAPLLSTQVVPSDPETTDEWSTVRMLRQRFEPAGHRGDRLLAYLLLGEALEDYHLMGAALVLPGIYLATRNTKPK